MVDWILTHRISGIFRVLRKMKKDLRSEEEFVESLSPNDYAQASAQWWRAKLEIAELNGQAENVKEAAERLCKVDKIRIRYWQTRLGPVVATG